MAICDEYEESCNRGEKIIKFMQVYPKILEMRDERENCTYTGVWKRTGPISDNVTGKFDSTEFLQCYTRRT